MATECLRWYRHESGELFGTPPPDESDKVAASTESLSAVLTWQKLHQQPKYLADLRLDSSAFSGMRLLDVGSGPLPSGLVFDNCELFCLDPLFPEYLRAGFPLHCYDRVRFVTGLAEAMPIADGFFDAIISANAIDHVDDLFLTAGEIRRVLKRGGRLRIHAHYHKSTSAEPLELSDDVLERAFSWCGGFRKLHESRTKFGWTAGPGESYALWSNFE
jgi:SAM-dependent methyltransferase